MSALQHIEIHGFKSIRKASVNLGKLNVLIGANGSGKSNFISAFRFLNALAHQNLGIHIGRAGGVDTILHFGQKETEKLRFNVTFCPNDLHQLNEYACSLLPSQDDAFVFQNEAAFSHNCQPSIEPHSSRLGSGYRESLLQEKAKKDEIARSVYQSIKSWRIYHLHDTSETAKIKQSGDIHDNHFLHADGSNLAAYLYLLRATEPYHYRMITGAIRLVAPFFNNFELRPSPLNPEKIRLEWSEQHRADSYFNAHALSDGTLRFMGLVTLLLQPPNRLPTTILLDEPELGLHPYAITILADLLRRAAQHTQVIVSTQSVTLVNQLEPDDILVVEYQENQSTFSRLSNSEIEHWLDGYGLGDLWEKNILGGRPT